MSEFFEGMAEIFEVDVSKISSEFELHSGEAAWDSLAIVSTIALADDCFNVMLEGKGLTQISEHLLVLAIWGGVSFALALRWFKWT